MRWKISRHGHDPRQIDLLAALALLVIIVAGYRYLSQNPEPPSTTAFIVPSQSVRWSESCLRIYPHQVRDRPWPENASAREPEEMS